NSVRRLFSLELWNGLKVVWPILSGLLVVMVLLGMVIAWREGWHLGDGLYFAFVSGLTIGYGDLVPKHPMSRMLAIAIGGTGILLTGLVAAVAVRALERATKR
ncbi:MAG TPA: potassium channel family protein, partial [Burkholderiales bacterium]|nr:potassium channel family protein [Burkholderiales bacterium]